MKAAAILRPPAVLSRCAAALLGGYLFCWGFVSSGIPLLGAAGMDYEDAWMLVMMLVFPLFLTLFLWAFAARNLRRVWLVLAGGGAALTALSLLLVSRIPGVS